MKWLAGLCGGDDEPEGKPLPDVPRPPIAARDDLYFGYFGSDDAQVDETRDHVNLLFAAFGDDASLAARMAHAGVAVILDVSDCLWKPAMPRSLRDDWRTALKVRLDAVRAAGGLSLVRWLYVIDEPERESNVGEVAVAAACLLLRDAMADYPELVHCGLHICYGDGEDYRGIGSIDLVGIDAYGQGADILTGQLQRLKPYLRPDQRIALYPGGASPWRQDPRPFLEYANGDPQVAAIIPFIWLAANNGIVNNGMADAYRAVGRAILQANKGA